MSRNENALMYRLQVRLVAETPDTVLQILRIMIGQRPPRTYMARHLPGGPLAAVSGWYNLLRNTTTISQRFASHECGELAGGVQVKYTRGMAYLRQYDDHYQLKAIGVSAFEEQDFALLLNWLMPYIQRVEEQPYLALVQSFVFHTPRTNRRKTKAGLIKLYTYPKEGDYPALEYRSGQLVDLVKHIL